MPDDILPPPISIGPITLRLDIADLRAMKPEQRAAYLDAVVDFYDLVERIAKIERGDLP